MSKCWVIEGSGGQYLAAGTTVIDGVCTPVLNYDPSFAIRFLEKEIAEKLIKDLAVSLPTLGGKLKEIDDPYGEDWNDISR
jgi:hypothetical protein